MNIPGHFAVIQAPHRRSSGAWLELHLYPTGTALVEGLVRVDGAGYGLPLGEDLGWAEGARRHEPH
jgi:hypothetical protein